MANEFNRPVELLLEEDDFGQPAQIVGGGAIGLILSNIFKTPKGTIPDAPDVSILLKDIATGVVDDSQIIAIQNTVKNLLARFLPDIPFTEVEVVQHTDEKGDVVLLLGIKSAENQYVFKALESKDYTIEEVTNSKEDYK
ncbi:MAG: hypothetical protein ACRC0G_07725 [Fusobacteriaceae bacterium]